MARIITQGIGLNPSAELEEWRSMLALYGKKLRRSRIKIINGHVHYNGTIDNLTHYWLNGLHCARVKSSLDGKRFQKDKCFEGSRRSAERFAEGNKLASRLYAMVEKEKKVYPLFCFLKKRAILLIKEGKTTGEAEDVLMDYLKEFGLLPEVPNTTGSCQGHLLENEMPRHFYFGRTRSSEIVRQSKIIMTSDKSLLSPLPLLELRE